MNKLITLILIMYAPLLYALDFTATYDMSAKGFSAEANMVTQYFTANVEKTESTIKDELSYLTSSLASQESENTNNPVYWFVRGMHARNMASYYQQHNQAEKAKNAILAKNQAYSNAIRLDAELNQKNDESNQQFRLSAAAYSAMKAGLPDVLKQKAIESELNLGGSGENESYYWYLHWSNVNALQKQGRIEEAELALQRMNKELHESDQDIKLYSKLIDQVKSELQQRKQEIHDAKSEQDSSSAITSVSHETYTDEDSDIIYYKNLLIVAIIMLCLIGVGVILKFYQRKNTK